MATNAPKESPEAKTAKKRLHRIEYYNTKTLNSDPWHWRMRHSNGNIQADGAEGYASRGSIERNLKSLTAAINFPGQVVEVDAEGKVVKVLIESRG